MRGWCAAMAGGGLRLEKFLFVFINSNFSGEVRISPRPNTAVPLAAACSHLQPDLKLLNENTVQSIYLKNDCP